MNSLANSLIAQSLTQATDRLQQFAQQPNFLEQLRVAFGDNFDSNVGLEIGLQFQSGDFNLIPDIHVLSNGELGTANGAYAGALDEIFVSSDFLAGYSGDVTAVTELLLEEIGHKIDRVLNGNLDSPGDEGAIFRHLVTGRVLAAETLAGLKNQDDHTVISVNGQSVEVEQQDFTGTAGDDTLRGTDGDDRLFGLAGNDELVGLTGADAYFGGFGNDTA
jgi:Ca2+-binding RTX toxin-like protein